jgi:hypothetical protein
MQHIHWKKFIGFAGIAFPALLIGDVLIDLVKQQLDWALIISTKNITLKLAAACLGALIFAYKQPEGND